ncbi:MAG: hypothetical protein K0Q95_1903 [Bacteroidota bacterium]|jgi:hypothetical protein|nr:hypothetical protein [Bacteroidota bacterium]
MTINKHNYEAFFLDYHEGNLSPQQVADLLLFVEQHPELKAEFESFENFHLEDYSSYTFENKDSLKKEITLQNYEEYFIRSVEGSLNPAEINLFESFLNQHPQYLSELNLYQKTKLSPEENIFFENKQALKRSAPAVLHQETAGTDHLLISAVEGLLSTGENELLHQQLKADSSLQTEFELFKKTRVKADPAIVFENKNELKRKNKKVVPLFYYWSAAAAVLLLFGLYFTFNNGKTEKQDIAKNNILVPKEKVSGEPAPFVVQNEKDNSSLASAIQTPNSRIIQKTQKDVSVDTLNINKVENTTPEINIALNSEEKEVIREDAAPIEKDAVASLNNNVKEVEKSKAVSKEFLSLREIAAAKIKEKTLDAEVLAMEKKTGREKKFSGWDVLQVVAKGVSKITGKKVEAKPTYNDQGEVTAYALGAGSFQFSRGKRSN